MAATVYQCLHGMAPAYLTELSLRQQVVVAVFGPSQPATWSYHGQPTARAFSVAGPVCRNALPDYLKSSDLSFDVFKHQLKTFFVDTDTSTTVAH